jgi:hypothetical protein
MRGGFMAKTFIVFLVSLVTATAVLFFVIWAPLVKVLVKLKSHQLVSEGGIQNFMMVAMVGSVLMGVAIALQVCAIFSDRRGKSRRSHR